MGVSQVALVVKNLPANAGDTIDAGSIPGSGRFPWRRKWQSTPVFFFFLLVGGQPLYNIVVVFVIH